MKVVSFENGQQIGVELPRRFTAGGKRSYEERGPTTIDDDALGADIEEVE